jgi:hypothetical protein
VQIQRPGVQVAAAIESVVLRVETHRFVASGVGLGRPELVSWLRMLRASGERSTFGTRPTPRSHILLSQPPAHPPDAVNIIQGPQWTTASQNVVLLAAATEPRR